MPQSPDPIDKMSPADKLLRVGTLGSFALLLLFVTIQSFSDGAPRSAPAQVAEATVDAESSEVASAEDAAEPAAEEPAAPMETAEVEPAPASTEDVIAEADPAPVEEAPTAEVAEAETIDWLQQSPLLASADIESGKSAFRQCSACHQYDNARNGGGPHLVGIVGRDMAAVDEWRYSNALLEQEGIWTPEKLNQWLINPDDYIPGNRMAYPGVRSEQERIDIIGFLAAQAQ